MHQTAGTDTGPRWELRAHVASSVLFAAAVVGLLFLPWDRSEGRTGLDRLLSVDWSDMARHPDWPGLAGLVVLVAVPVVGLALSLRRTRRAAVARAILAAASATWLALLGIALAFGLTGRPPEWIGGWVTFWALVGAFVANVIAARAGRRPRTETEGPNARSSLGVHGS